MLLNLLLQIQSEVAEAAPAEEVVPTEETLSVIELLASGGWYIMIPLGILSVVAVYIFIERFLAIQKASKEDPQFMNQIKDFIHDGKIDAANHLCKQTDSTFARMIEKGVRRIGKPLSDISASVENVAKLEVYKLEESLSTLATIAGAAPMIGFLGTVIGMIVVFHEMRISDAGIEIEQLSSYSSCSVP